MTGAAAEIVNFDLVSSEVVPGESHNPAVATSTDSTTFHVHIAPQVAQNFLTHMKFRFYDFVLKLICCIHCVAGFRIPRALFLFA